MDVEQQYTCDFIKQTMGLSNRFIGFLHVELKGLLDRLYFDTWVPPLQMVVYCGEPVSVAAGALLSPVKMYCVTRVASV